MYPVVWRGQTFPLNDLTVGMKNEFVKWTKLRLTQEGIENLGQRPDLLTSYLSTLYGEVWWGDGMMSKPVHAMLTSPDGGRQFNRLLFGDSVRVLSDTDLTALLDEKEGEQARADEKAKAMGLAPPYPPVNDYMVAMQMIREQADPKAKGRVTGAGPPGAMSSTATTSTTPSGKAA